MQGKSSKTSINLYFIHEVDIIKPVQEKIQAMWDLESKAEDANVTAKVRLHYHISVHITVVNAHFKNTYTLSFL